MKGHRPARNPRIDGVWIRQLVYVLSIVAAGCGGPRPGVLERPAPIAWVDTLPIHEPRERTPSEVTELLRNSVKDEIGYGVALDRRISGKSDALNVTAFDDVVPSSWFEHRITTEVMTPERLVQGPPGADPDTTGMFEVVAAKVGGVSPGFTVRDRKGDRYLLKFDPPGHPGLASGADVIVSRIFWAAGYHVPRDVLLRFDRADLRIAEGTVIDTPDGERAMTDTDVDVILDAIDPLPDGRYHALASQFVPGVPKGPFFFEDTRKDDPNDYYPHEKRRDLRGLWVLAAWTDHVDLRFQNTLDVWITPTGYLRHYLIDFGATLGSRSIRIGNAREGREFSFDLWATLARTATLGLYRVGWEGIDDEPIHPSLGWFARGSFDPERWKPFWPNEAYRKMSVRDGYWGAKLVGAFDRTHLEALIAAARYPDPEADRRLLDILEYRQFKLLRYWYGRVSPLESPRISGTGGDSGDISVSFDDLGLTHGLWSADETVYRWELKAPDGGTWADGEAPPSGDGVRQSIGIPRPTDDFEPDSVPVWTLEVTTIRPDARDRPVRIAFVPEDGGYRVVELVH